MTRTPWVKRRSTQAPTVLSGSMSVPLTVDDSTPGGPPWTSLPSTSASTEDAQELSSTESQLHPTGILTTPSRLAQPSIVSGERHSSSWQSHLKTCYESFLFIFNFILLIHFISLSQSPSWSPPPTIIHPHSSLVWADSGPLGILSLPWHFKSL